MGRFDGICEVFVMGETERRLLRAVSWIRSPPEVSYAVEYQALMVPVNPLVWDAICRELDALEDNAKQIEEAKDD